MSLLYIFAASAAEAQPVRKVAAAPNGSSALRCGPNELVLFTGAMGPRNAKSTADAAFGGKSGSIASRKPDAVLVIGLCGGLNPSLPQQRIVAYTECLGAESTSRLACSQTITDSVISLLASAGIRCDPVVGITSPRIATTPAEKRELAARSGAAVVDMESYSILQTAAIAGIPAAVIRVVSDSSEWQLPDLNRALNDSGALDGWKALKVALGSPLSTLRLLAANRRAMQTLAKALDILLKTDCFAFATR